MRVVCLDIGERRIGVAVSDLLDLTAQGVETIWVKGMEKDCARIEEICRQYETTHILCGLPLNMDGTLGGQAQKAQDFGRVLEEKQGLTVFYQDERMTTVTAENVLIGGNVRREDRKLYVDKLAAAVILEQWLASQQK